MEAPQVTLIGVEEVEGKFYSARISVTYAGKTGEFTIRNLVKKPARLGTPRIEGDFIVVELLDENGNGISTCCIPKRKIAGASSDCPDNGCP